MAKLFQDIKKYEWKEIKPFHLRNQYNELLHIVVNEYFTKQYPNAGLLPNFLNKNYCLTLLNFNRDCKCPPYLSSGQISFISKGAASNLKKEDVDVANAESLLAIAERGLDAMWNAFEAKAITLNVNDLPEVDKLRDAVKARKDISDTISTAEKEKNFVELKIELAALKKSNIQFEADLGKLKKAEAIKYNAEFADQIKLDAERREYEDALTQYEIAQRNFDFESTKDNQDRQANAKNHFEQLAKNFLSHTENKADRSSLNCHDVEDQLFCMPKFSYERIKALKDSDLGGLDLTLNLKGLTVGAAIWLYYYERMGIFKILGVLMDDYNYRGKYTISGSRSDKNGNANTYSVLMDLVCTLYRLGIGSNLRDRICTYQRVLGVSIENNLGITSERNTGFMQTFNTLIDYKLEYYKTKQLAQAIQAQSGNTQPRSSVATQTSIRDTINLLKQQFEPFEYGRNQINTFLGIATVHATLCLVNMLRKEIGIPDQYERPEEFIPAAYDILVTKKPKTLNETNRFIVYDNCASYGYRLLTDIEMLDLTQITTIATGSTLDTWLNDIEGIVEGYNNAFKSISEPASSIV
jgi:hypothetical protein